MLSPNSLVEQERADGADRSRADLRSAVHGGVSGADDVALAVGHGEVAAEVELALRIVLHLPSLVSDVAADHRLVGDAADVAVRRGKRVQVHVTLSFLSAPQPTVTNAAMNRIAIARAPLFGTLMTGTLSAGGGS